METLQDRFRKLVPDTDKNIPTYAKEIGVTKPTLYAIREGVTTAENIKARVALGICERFGVELHWFVLGKQPMRLKSHNVTLDPEILAQAILFVDYDEKLSGPYSPEGKAARLIEICDLIAKDGGKPSMATTDAILESARARKDSGDKQ